MAEAFSIFRKYSNLEQAQELKMLLSNNNIESILDDNIPPVDVTFIGNTLNHEFEVRIKATDFNKAEAILNNHEDIALEEVDKDYYLLNFSNEELCDVLLKSDEWSAFDYSLTQKILTNREQSIDKNLLNSLKNQRLIELAKPETNQKPWIISGYIFALLGGFLGLIIGYFLWTSQKTLPNGQKIYSYTTNNRMHGKYIFFISLIIFPLSLLIRIISNL
jgi:hypothetical protein